ncbi:PilZ domain-containing protein [Methylococcus sp. EFPC2]|uniref:PilZ domain-containing protein n=1 Tax=Methylococcus sp. EFPC2 TaxID=2812648 RepID=UPI001967F1B1|nr:PilZ domain-containing protein [Methylococcus sp. EFPC2]QSA95641.1 PilZ domain-containing protein [Methylococcus sp. EFPC2]
MSDYIEKRTFARSPAHCRLSFNLIDRDGVRDGSCLDVSAAGILFITDRPVEPGRAVEIRTSPDNPNTPPLTAFAEITRCIPDERGFQIAAAIKGIKAD